MKIYKSKLGFGLLGIYIILILISLFSLTSFRCDNPLCGIGTLFLVAGPIFFILQYLNIIFPFPGGVFGFLIANVLFIYFLGFLIEVFINLIGKNSIKK